MAKRLDTARQTQYNFHSMEIFAIIKSLLIAVTDDCWPVDEKEHDTTSDIIHVMLFYGSFQKTLSLASNENSITPLVNVFKYMFNDQKANNNSSCVRLIKNKPQETVLHLYFE